MQRPLPSAWLAGGWRVPPVLVDLARTADRATSVLFSLVARRVGEWRVPPAGTACLGGGQLLIRAGSPGLSLHHNTWLKHVNRKEKGESFYFY
jgi:hypothetical protein